MSDDESMSLLDLAVHLQHVWEDIDIADEQLLNHRHRINDPGAAAQLRAAGDDLNDAWRSVAAAIRRVQELLATNP